jgi:hypothetical protein
MNDSSILLNRAHKGNESPMAHCENRRQAIFRAKQKLSPLRPVYYDVKDGKFPAHYRLDIRAKGKCVSFGRLRQETNNQGKISLLLEQKAL